MKVLSFMVLLLIQLVLSSLVFGTGDNVDRSVNPAQTCTALWWTNNSSDTVKQGSRNFGPLVINYCVINDGYKLGCTLILSDELVGMSTLTDNETLYIFDTVLNTYKAWGTFTAQYYPPDQISTLEADIYVVSPRTDTLRFKGTVTGWYTTQQVAPQSIDK